MGVYGSAATALRFCMAHKSFWWQYVLDKIVAFLIWCCNFFCCRENCTIFRWKEFCIDPFISSIYFWRLPETVFFIPAKYTRSLFLDDDSIQYDPLCTNTKK